MSERITLVVPCFDEAARLRPEVFAAFVRAHPGIGLLFVDDGSRDGTRAILEALQRDMPSDVEVLALPRNAGKGEAVRQGMLRAIAAGATVTGFWDADLATPLDELPDMLATLEGDAGLDAVIGSRVKLLGRTIERQATRHYLGRVFATAASLTLRLGVYDTQCGAKIFRVTPRLRQVVATPFLSRWIFDVELLARLDAASPDADYRLETAVREYPLREWRDHRGSKRRMRDLLGAALDLWRIHRTYGAVLRLRRSLGGVAYPS